MDNDRWKHPGKRRRGKSRTTCKDCITSAMHVRELNFEVASDKDKRRQGGKATMAVEFHQSIFEQYILSSYII